MHGGAGAKGGQQRAAGEGQRGRGAARQGWHAHADPPFSPRRAPPARAAAQGQFAASEEARKELQGALAKKQEAANRLALLQEELVMLANMSPADMAALQARHAHGARGRRWRRALAALGARRGRVAAGRG